MMPEYVTRTVAVVVLPKGDSLFSEQATRIEIVDEAAGEFVRISQEGGHTDQAKWLMFNAGDEWTTVRMAVDQMMGEIQRKAGSDG